MCFEMLECVVRYVFYDFESALSGRPFEYLAVIVEFEIAFSLSEFVLDDDVIYPDLCGVFLRIDLLEIGIHLPFDVFLYDLFYAFLHISRNVCELIGNHRFVCHSFFRKQDKKVMKRRVLSDIYAITQKFQSHYQSLLMKSFLMSRFFCPSLISA